MDLSPRDTPYPDTPFPSMNQSDAGEDDGDYEVYSD